MSKSRPEFLATIIISAIIFAMTALVGVWAAPDRSATLIRLMLIFAGLLLMGGIAWLARRNTETVLGVAGLICGFLAAILTIYFLLTVNWAEAGSGQISLVQQIGLWIHNYSLKLSMLPNPHKNLTGGALIILLPLGLSGVFWAWSRGYRAIGITAMLGVGLALGGLVMTVSRGAWMGFGIGIVFAGYFYWRLGSGRHSPLRWPGDILLVGGILAFGGVFRMALIAPEYEKYLNLITGSSSLNRAQLWRDSLPLIQDYRFTGSGLSSATMVYSSYIFLLHVPFLAHAHNLFMQIAIEQGVPGLMAFLSMTVFAGWGLIEVSLQSSKQIRQYCAAAAAALAAMLVHGMVEAGIYAHYLIPIMFLPFGFALALMLDQKTITWSDSKMRRVQRIGILGSLAPSIAIIILFLWPGSLAAFQANLGAVTQSRTELAVYHWPDWSIQDELRRSNAIDLADSINHYQAALARDSANVTAHRRLGQIALSLGRYDKAQYHLETAYAAAPEQRPTRQMLGEVYAITGNLEQAVALWQTLDVGQGQLEARQWWHSHVGTEQQVDWLAEAITQLRLTDEQ